MDSAQVPKSEHLTPKRLRQVLVALSKERGKPIVWTGVLVKMCGDHALAAVLDQSLAWQRVKDRGAPDAWWWKTDGDWEEEIGVGRKAMTRARGVLPACGVEAEKRRAPGGNERVWHYRVCWDTFLKRLAAVLETTVEKIFAIVRDLLAQEREARKRRLAQVIRHVRDVRTVPSGQFKVSQVDSSNRPNGTVQSVPSGQLEVSDPDMTLILLDPSTGSFSGSSSDQQPPTQTRAREDTAGVGVEIIQSPDMKNSLQEEEIQILPGWEAALAIAQRKQAAGQLRTGDVQAYANGVLLRQQMARGPEAVVKEQVGIAADLEAFITE